MTEGQPYGINLQYNIPTLPRVRTRDPPDMMVKVTHFASSPEYLDLPSANIVQDGRYGYYMIILVSLIRHHNYAILYININLVDNNADELSVPPLYRF